MSTAPTSPGPPPAAPADPAAATPIDRARAREGPAVFRGGRRFWLLLALIVLGALAVRFDYARNVAPDVPALGDAHAYRVLGANLADGRGYIRPYDFERDGVSITTAEYPPVFPAVLAVADRAGLDTVPQQRLAMAVLGSLTVAVIGLAGRRLVDPGVGLTAAAIAAVHPMLFQADAALMPETLAALLGAAVVLAALVARTSTGVRAWAVLGGAIGLSTLARAEAGILLPLLVVPLAWRSAGADHRRRLLLGAVAVAVAIGVVAPWTVRNAVRFGSFVPVSNNIGSVARGANCELAYEGQFRGLWVTNVGNQEGRSVIDPESRCFSGFPIRPGVDEADASAELRSQGLRYARDHAGSLPGVMTARLGRTLGVYRFEQQTAFESLEGRSLTWQRRGTRVFHVLAVLAVAGALVLARRRQAVWPPLAMVLAVVVTTMATYGNQRFRASAEPAVILLAAVALVAAVRAVARRAATA